MPFFRKRMRSVSVMNFMKSADLLWHSWCDLLRVSGDGVIAGRARGKSLEPFAGGERILVRPEFDQVLDGVDTEIAFFKSGQPSGGLGGILLGPALHNADDGVGFKAARPQFLDRQCRSGARVRF